MGSRACAVGSRSSSPRPLRRRRSSSSATRCSRSSGRLRTTAPGARRWRPGRTPAFRRTARSSPTPQGRRPILRPELMVAPVDGSSGPGESAGLGWRETSIFDWSPDSSHDRCGARSRTRPQAPCPDRRRYRRPARRSRAASSRRQLRAGRRAAGVRQGGERRLPAPQRRLPGRHPGGQPPARQPVHPATSARPTRSGARTARSSSSSCSAPSSARYGPKNELYLMNSDGKQVRRLTHTKVGPLLLQGLYPTHWSANGKRLLAEFGGQDTSYAVTVNPQTGAQRPLIEATEQGFVGTALSADGKLVLGATGGFEPGPGTTWRPSPTAAASRRCSPRTPSNPTGVAEQRETEMAGNYTIKHRDEFEAMEGSGECDLEAGAQGARHLGLRLQPGRDRARWADPGARRGPEAARSSSTSCSRARRRCGSRARTTRRRPALSPRSSQPASRTILNRSDAPVTALLIGVQPGGGYEPMSWA